MLQTSSSLQKIKKGSDSVYNDDMVTVLAFYTFSKALYQRMLLHEITFNTLEICSGHVFDCKKLRREATP